MTCTVVGVEAPTWPRFVKAALGFSLTAGGLTGALDLWTLRIQQLPVPVDHQRGHALAQLFGFLLLFLMGLSLHLAPRFFGAAPPSRRFGLRLWWSAFGGAALLVLGRLGALLPGSLWLGLLGALLLVGALTTWATRLLGYALGAVDQGLDALQRSLVMGALWWWASGVTLLLWQLGVVFGGVTERTPLELVWTLALFGGAGSWLFGLFFRPGIMTLGLARPSERMQRLVFWSWQTAVVLTVLASWSPGSWLEGPAGVAMAGAASTWWWVVRPFSGKVAPGSLQPRALQAGAVFFLLFGALEAWSALGSAPLLRDAARHVFTLGVVTSMLFGFAGRMVPGFSGSALRWVPAYDAGLMALVAGTALRVTEVTGTRVGVGLSGLSGALTFGGIALVAATLLKTLTPEELRLPDMKRA